MRKNVGEKYDNANQTPHSLCSLIVSCTQHTCWRTDLRTMPSHSAMNISWTKASVIKHAFGDTLHKGLTPAATLASWAGVVIDKCAGGGLLLHVVLLLLLL